VTPPTKKKLIEVALPLEAINKASAREKSIRHGHPSTLHLWWARRPLAAARAVIFAQMVDDPSAHPDLFPTAKKQEKERQRLFRIIEDLVLWENTTNETVLQRARDEIWQSWRYTCAENADHPRARELFDRYQLPAFHDPFAGGGALPLEAQRLGLESHASDLNPVAVLINKAMIEIPPRFAGRPPVHPDAFGAAKAGKGQAAVGQEAVGRVSGASRVTRQSPPETSGYASLTRPTGSGELFAREWKGAQGLAEDVRYYGQWMRDEAERRIGHLYPKIEVTAAMVEDPGNPRPDLKPYLGRKLTVIAWLWARTVKSPNPAFATVEVPLASTFMLSTKAGKEAYVEPVLTPSPLAGEGGGEGASGYRFTVKVGKPKDVAAAKSGTKLSRGANFQCLMSGMPIASDHIYGEANAGRMGARLMAIVAEGDRGRVYLAPTPEMEAIALTAQPTWKPEVAMPENPRWFSPPLYGLKTYGDLFTPRQLVALTTFSDLVQEARERVKQDAIYAGLPADSKPLRDGGTGAIAYAEAVGVYLAFALSKLTDYATTLCRWFPERDSARSTFSRQALPMSWDFTELNPTHDATGSLRNGCVWVAESMESVAAGDSAPCGTCNQGDAAAQSISADKVVSTDPPYYDNIGYADLSDFFYVWLRRSLKPIFPELFATLAVPKAEELVATPYRHGSKEKAENFFLDGMTRAMRHLAEQAHTAFPVTIYYAFKQAESDGADGTTNTGWDTFLAAVIKAGFAISGTWPMRTELGNRMIGSGTNALASSIVLVCRKRPLDAPTATRREFVAALKTELPQALAHLQRGNIAPVDLAQAAIGPGMAVYTRYAQVLDAEGKPLPVRAALALINQTLDEALAEQEGDFDADSRWALTWFDQTGFAEGDYGVAEQLSKSKNTSVSGLAEAGILVSKAGKVRLLKPAELPADWDPTTDKRLTVWEMVHQLIRVLEAGGESAAAALVAQLGSQAEAARELCYRLYTLCERKKRAAEAMAYNGLVQSWPEITRLAQASPPAAATGTGDLFA
jgi:putative DNA methylase